MSENNSPINPDLIKEDGIANNIPSSITPEEVPMETPPQTYEQAVRLPIPVQHAPQQVEPVQPIAPIYQAAQQVEPVQPIAPIYQAPQQAEPTQPIAPIYQTPQQVEPVQPIAPTYQMPQQVEQQPYPQYTNPPVADPFAINTAQSNWDDTAVKKTNKSIMPIIIIALSLLVLGVVGFFVYRFVLFDPAAHDPKGTLMVAMENTKLDLESTGVTLPKQEKFLDQATSQTFNLTLDSAPDIIEFQPSLAGAKVSLGLQSDLDNRETMLAFGFHSDLLEVPNSKVYFTSEQTVIDSPTLHEKPLLINNKTFIRDWNASEYGEYSYIYEEGTLKDAIDQTFDLFEAVDPDTITEYEEMFSEFEGSLLASETLLNESMIVTHRETKDGRYVFDAIVKGSDVETYIDEVTGVMEDLVYTILSSIPSMTNENIDYAMSDVTDVLDSIRDDFYLEDEIFLEFIVDEETKRLLEYRILPTIITLDAYETDNEAEVELGIIFSGEEGTIKDIEMTMIASILDYPDDRVEVELKRVSTGSEGKDSVRWELVMDYTDGDYPEYSENYMLFLDYIWDKNIVNEANFFLKMGMKNTSDEEEYLTNVRGVLVETADSFSLSEGSFSFVYDSAEQFKVDFDYSCSVIEKGSIMPDISGGVDFFSVDPKDIVSGINDQIGGAL